MIRWYAHIIILAFAGLWLTKCTGTRFIPQGKKLYTGAEIKVQGKTRMEGKKEVERSLKQLLHPEPNTTVLGQRPALWLYHIAGKTNKKKGFKYWLKYKLGEPPVYMSDVDPERTTQLLQTRLQNKGFFQGRVNYKILEKKQQASIIYRFNPGLAYHYDSIHFPDSTSAVNSAIASTEKKSPLKKGRRFDLEVMSQERTRINKVIRDLGFYYFNESYLTYKADSTVGKHHVELFLKTRKDINPKATKTYHIENISIVPEYSINAHNIKYDTLMVDHMFYMLNPAIIRPKPILRSIKLQPHKLYSKEDEDITIQRLVNLDIFRYVNIDYQEDTVTNNLNATIHLIPSKRKSLRLELQAVSKSNNYVGPFLSATYQNRNIFGGAELFQLTVNSGIETQLNKQQNGALNSYELGLEASLKVPRMIAPFKIDESQSKFDFNTKFSAGIRSLRRVGYFNLRSLDLGFGYHWNRNIHHRFEIFPVDVSFLQLPKTTAKFDELLKNNELLQKSYQEQFILGGRYAYFFNAALPGQHLEHRDNFYLNANLYLSGNLMHLAQSTLNRFSDNPVSPNKIAGYPYAQFAKTDVDFRYYLKFDSRNTLATRVIAGIGVPFGNSQSLPYIHQFAIGGSSSLRAFRARSVGPGSYAIPDSIQSSDALIDQTADIKLEWNLEYRFDILKALKGAVFMDAGNIWTINNDANRPGSQFQFNQFLKEMAVGAGVGLRYDADFLVFRVDLATPLRIPSLPEGHRWVIKDLAINKSDWRKKNLVLNIAIGYPF